MFRTIMESIVSGCFNLVSFIGKTERNLLIPCAPLCTVHRAYLVGRAPHFEKRWFRWSIDEPCCNYIFLGFIINKDALPLQASFIHYTVQNEPLTSNQGHQFPGWAYGLGWVLALSSVLMIPLWAILNIRHTKGSLLEVSDRYL